MKPSTDIQLGTKRAIDTCSRLIRNSGFTSADVLENAENSSNVYLKAAAVELEDMRQDLRADVARWLETSTLSGFLSIVDKRQLKSLLRGRGKEAVHFEEEEEERKPPPRNFDIPILDMSSLKIESPKQQSSRQNTPSVSDIRTYEDIEVVEVSDSSAFDSQLMSQVADQMMNQLQQVKATASQKTALPRSTNMEFPVPSLNFIPSSPLSNARNTFTKAREAGVQTTLRAGEANEMVDVATSYDMQTTQDEGEVSTSDSSDPSLGQINNSRMASNQIVSVRKDGSLINLKRFPSTLPQSPRVSEVGWKAPLDMIRIAERDISSSFGSERIETVSANHSARGTPSMLGKLLLAGAIKGSPPSHSDEEPTINQVSQISETSQ